MTASGDAAVIEIREVSKRFPGVQALDSVSLDIRPGEIHAVAGENGAGKSTLMKLLSQLERPTDGSIHVGGRPMRFRNPRHAQQLGIAMVHQEFALAPHLSVADNLALGREETRLGLIVRGSTKRRARDLLKRVGLDINPARRVESLSVADQQRVEIAKALAVDARVVIMDEPTATLTEPEIDDLFRLIEELKADGIAIFYISHRLEEVVRIADRVTVMRDGEVVETLDKGEFDEPTLVRLMVGREIENLYPKATAEIGDVRLQVEGVTRPGVLQDCSFEVRAGEIVGFAGLIGAGRTELARAVFAADPITAGTIELDGRPLKLRSPSDAIAAGIGYLTEDRKGDGLAMQLPVTYNITLARIPGRGLWIDRRGEHRVAERRRDELDIRTPSLRRPVEALSGGTQQKVVVARWLETEARVLFFDEPSRGIDVGAKAELFKLIGGLAADGRAIVLISSYLPELTNMCDRIIVVRDGRTVGELKRDEFDEERIMALASGVERKAE
ncbi:MAG TPA: sugar ABC transporter ATP-binding protein [Solirubrobacteraceae bacterium]|nr:sugar ABC transporter ATP-binding protein [Solirubrobacteraceae bacterium]